jgi:maleate isomerase
MEALTGAVPELGICFDSLAAAGANVVAQFGFPFSLVHGWEEAQRIQEHVRGNRNTHFVMMGVETVYALRHFNCSSVAIASTYYSDRMSKILHEFLAAAGLDILQSENWESQGVVENIGSGVFVGDSELDPMDWETPVSAVERAVRDVATAAPGADCILVTGGGMRMLDTAETLENEVGKPIIGGDLVLYWGILRRLGINESVRGHGRLLASLG